MTSRPPLLQRIPAGFGVAPRMAALCGFRLDVLAIDSMNYRPLLDRADRALLDVVFDNVRADHDVFIVGASVAHAVTDFFFPEEE